MSASITLCGDGISEETLAEVAGAAGSGVVGQSGRSLAALSGPAAVLVADLDEERLIRSLRPPITACIEVDEDVGRSMADIPRQGLLVSLTTVTAYGLEVAKAFCDALADRVELADKSRQMMELALHEALVNAMVHGNLEIGSHAKDSLEDFMLFCQTIENRLSDRRYGARRTTIRADWSGDDLEVVVTDEGLGFDTSVMDRPIDLNRKSGRGLFLIKDICRSMAIEDGGRRLVMRFGR